MARSGQFLQFDQVGVFIPRTRARRDKQEKLAKTGDAEFQPTRTARPSTAPWRRSSADFNPRAA
jgi:hypothetical protein